MSCNSVATVSSQLKCDASLILASEQTVKAAALVIAKALGIDASQVSTSQWRDERYFYASPWQVTVDKQGRVQVSQTYGNYRELQAMTDKITSALGALAGLILQTKVQQLIASRFQVEQQQRTPQGAVVMTFSL